MSTYDCPEPGCDFTVSAVGPLDPDEPDYFTEEIEAHRRGHQPAPLSAEARAAIGDGLALAAAAFAVAADGHELRVGWRVVYVGSDPELTGKHGTVAVENAFPYLEGSTIVGVQFDGHSATWSIHPAHLALLALELHEPGCDCPPHVAATVTAVAADRAARGLPEGFVPVPALVQLDQAEAHAEARLIRAALAWEAAEHGTPWDYSDAQDELRAAAHDYRKVTNR